MKKHPEMNLKKVEFLQTLVAGKNKHGSTKTKPNTGELLRINKCSFYKHLCVSVFLT